MSKHRPRRATSRPAKTPTFRGATNAQIARLEGIADTVRRVFEHLFLVTDALYKSSHQLRIATENHARAVKGVRR